MVSCLFSSLRRGTVMSAHRRPLPFVVLKYALGVLVLGALVLTGWVAGDPPPANPPKSDKPAKPAPKRTEDEDDTPPPKSTKVQRVEDEDPKGKPPARSADVPEIDLLLASRQASHPAVRKLFFLLHEPHDVIHYKPLTGVLNAGKVREDDVAPIAEYIPNVEDYRGNVFVTPLDKEYKPFKDKDSQPVKPTKLNLGSVKSIEPYERLVMDEVNAFLRKGYDKQATVARDYLSRREQLVAAEQALDWALRFHVSAKQLGQRKGESWEPLEGELRKLLLDVRIDQLKDLAEAKDFDRAFALTKRLAEKYTTAEDQAQIAGPLTDLLNKALASAAFSGNEGMRAARLRLRQLAQQFPNNKAIKPITDSLLAQAQALLDEAKRLGDDPTTAARAQELLKQAEETWPQLEGLRAFRIKLAQSHPILHVGVRGELPKYLSPARAGTDTELRAVELLFEGLVKLSSDESGVVRYRAGLAEGRPAVVALGRRFSLPRGARWSNNRELTAADVRFTVRHLLNGAAPRPTVWQGLLEDSAVGHDPFQVTVSLRQGYVDPLSLMTFKVVPDGLPTPVDSEAFATKPVGSGPFVFDGIRSDEAKRPYAGFTANPNYGSRPSKIGLPRIQEVRFYTTTDPVKDLKEKRIDLALDLTAEQALALKKQRDVTVSLPPRPVPNRRVYFLAANLRRPALAHVEVRRALAHAINREKLLDDHFRGGLELKPHRALNGPYPANTWACNPRRKARAGDDSLDPFDAAVAGAMAKAAREKMVGPATLTLKYPEGDPALDKAMEDLKEQVKKVIGDSGFGVQPVKRDPRALKEDVEVLQDFDLAYTYYDYPTETYSLWPLLGPGKENVFAFTNPEVETLLQEMRGHRHFADVQQCAQQLHEVLFREMPMIPLWQLDPLLAWHRTVQPVALDPQMVFTEIDQWRLNPRPE
jgi:peptide/nickel transport system substrate-binding protein